MTHVLKPLNRVTVPTQPQYPERVVQFGGGNFLRAFIDWMVEVLNEQTGFASSVVVVKPTPQGSYQQWTLQDNLFHVRLHGLQAGKLVTERKLITCVSRVVNPYSDYQALIDLACQPDIRFIVSNTTEAGLSFAPNDQLTDTPPTSFPAKLAVFLYHRFRHFDGSADQGCILLPCELVEQNGDRLRQIVLQYADLWQLETAFKQWITDSNLFCNTLVDRIVPGFPQTGSDIILEQLGFDDQLLVEAEQYHSWIIQAPQWLENELSVHHTTLNVRIVDDVQPYRETKVRILNGAHTAMTPVGVLLGLETVREAVEHPQLGAFIRDLLSAEIIPSFGAPDPELNRFADEVLNRFRNPFIQHRLLSIALNSISKFRVRLLPSLLAYTEHYQHLPQRIVFAFAALLRFYQGKWNGIEIPINDDPAVIAWLQTQWRSDREISAIVETILANESLWEQDLTRIDGLADQLSTYLTQMDSQGIDHALEHQDW